MERRQIGHIMVDSGQIFIIDPCYLDHWKHGDYAANVPPDNSYARVTDAMFAGGGFAEAERGVVCSSDGDSIYPVYATIDDQGYISKIEIILRGEESEESENEDES